MKLAFSTSVEPSWSLATITNVAKELGYAGIEVQLPNPTADDPAAGSPLQERELVRLAFEQVGVQLAGIAAPLHFTGDDRRDLLTSDAVRRIIELAARLKCSHIRILDMALPPAMSRGDGIVRLSDRLAALAELAADAGTSLLVQNALSFRLAGDLWKVLEQAMHPALCIAWDPLAAALAGEPAALAVQVLNSRIQQVLLRDAQIIAADGSPALAGLKLPGEGSLPLSLLMDRLRGIGYTGWVCINYPAASGVGEARSVLAAAAAQFEKWKPVAKKPVRPAAAKAGK